MRDVSDNFRPVPRVAAIVATTVFLVLILLPGLFHLRYGLRRSDLRRWGDRIRTQPTADAMRSIDQDFDRRFLLRFVATSLTEKVPEVQARLNNDDVQTGTGGFLFATEDTQVCTAAGFLHPQFPRPAIAADQIADFNRQLQKLNIHLVVVPIPAKATIYPDRLDPHYEVSRGPFVNVDNDRWFRRLRDSGVDAVDLTPLFWSHRNDAGVEPLFYPADTHWTDRGKRLAAGAIASHLTPLLTELAPATPYQVLSITRVIYGNLTGPAADGSRASVPFREQVDQLRYDAPLSTDAPILLLGDSQAAIGSESHTGFQQRLIQALGTDVQSLAEAGAGPDEMRRVIAQDPDSLRHKRVVIWVFSIRHLLIKEWNPVTYSGRLFP
jgi:alginate O-acetyltransferase complex protein AlgJ